MATSRELIQAILDRRVDKIRKASVQAVERFLAQGPPIREGESMTPEQADVLKMHGAFLDMLPLLYKLNPAITVSRFIAFVRLAWPATRGPSSAPDPAEDAVMLAAHTALLQESETKCEGACQTLGASLNIDQRTVHEAILRARRRQSRPRNNR